jgi:magnesium chelatase family protein
MFSGPLLDRIDLHIEVPQVKFWEMSNGQPGETSAQICERVVAARNLQQTRVTGGPKVTCNARMGARELQVACELDEPTRDLLKHAMMEYNLSDHVSEAIQYRSFDRQLWG